MTIGTMYEHLLLLLRCMCEKAWVSGKAGRLLPCLRLDVVQGIEA